MKPPRSVAISRYGLWAVLALPFVFLLVGYYRQQIYYGEMLHISGELSARLLMVALAVTPLSVVFPTAGWTLWLRRHRRSFGVAVFAYGLLHTLVYVGKQESAAVVLDEGSSFDMWTGWAALAIFLALAVTSNDVSMRIMGRAWKKLHRWVYAATALTFAHWLFIAFDFVPGLIHLLVIAALQAMRMFRLRRPSGTS